MNILLTGGLGYIGSSLYNKLSKNDNITILDNSPKMPKENKFSIKGDILDKKIVNNTVRNNDILVHLAAQIDMSRSIQDPIFDAENNINGTLNVLEAARKSDTKCFIYISSAAIFGYPNYLPIDENHPTNPISPYGLSKLTGERYSMLYHDLYGLPVVCLRFFNVFGPRQTKNSYSGVITKFLENTKNDISPIIFGDGGQTRDFVYIDDITDSILLAMKNRKAIGEVFNIGTGNPIKIKDLAETVIKISNKNLHPKFEDSRKGDIIESYADITKARKILGYEPKYSLEKGLKICFDQSTTIIENKNFREKIKDVIKEIDKLENIDIFPKY